MIRNIVFDMGNVLLDHDPLLPCIRHAGHEHAQTLCDAIFRHPEWMRFLDSGEMDENAYAPYAQARLSDPALRRLVPEILDDWHLDALYPKSGMDQVQKDMLESGMRLYVLSNAGFSFHDFSYKIKYIRRFSGVMISSEERLLKPDPAIYLRLCERFSLVPKESLFIDDLPRNIAGAESIGMRGYCFEDGDVARLRAYLSALNG